MKTNNIFIAFAGLMFILLASVSLAFAEKNIPECCKKKEACCETKESCCPEKLSHLTADCCKAQKACCEPKQDCCTLSNNAAKAKMAGNGHCDAATTSQADCCQKKEACCEPKQACCAENKA
jgi:hypothetical protein